MHLIVARGLDSTRRLKLSCALHLNALSIAQPPFHHIAVPAGMRNGGAASPASTVRHAQRRKQGATHLQRARKGSRAVSFLCQRLLKKLTWVFRHAGQPW